MALSTSTHESSLSRRYTWVATVEQRTRVRTMVDKYSDFVARTLLTAGVPESDLDDEVQRTFLVAAHRLEDVRLGSERAFLYRVARHTAAHVGRSRRRCREIPSGDLFDASSTSDVFASPENWHDAGRCGRSSAASSPGCASLCARCSFFTISGMQRNEIAALLDLPEGTVASQLRSARKEIRTLVARQFASAGRYTAVDPNPREWER